MRSRLNRLMARSLPPAPVRTSARRPVVIEDKTTPHVAPPCRESWDVVMLSPHANDGTLARIDAAGFDVWRPRMVVMLSSASVGKHVKVNRPLWPRYAFVARRPECRVTLSSVWDIGKPLCIGSVHGSTVEAISIREAAGEFDGTMLPPEAPAFDPGAQVETLDGLMQGIVLKSDEARTVVLFRLMDAEREVQVETGRLRLSAGA
jgi:hypothetical protein